MPILKWVLHIKTIIIDPMITNDIKVPDGNIHHLRMSVDTIIGKDW